MIKSMTGYGRAVETVNGREFTVELRSVNNRFLDYTVLRLVDIVFSRGFRRFRRGHLLREIRGICVSPPQKKYEKIHEIRRRYLSTYHGYHVYFFINNR